MREELYLLPPLQDLLPHRNNRSSRATRSKLFKPTWRGTASSAPNGDDRMRTGRLAAWVRDQEVHALEQRNEELERALVEANSVMRVFGSGGGNGQAAAEPCGAGLIPPGAQAGPQVSSEDPGPSGADGGELRGAGLKGPPGLDQGAAQTAATRAPHAKGELEMVVSRQLELREVEHLSLCIYLWKG